MEYLVSTTHMRSREALQNAIEMEGDPAYALLSLANAYLRRALDLDYLQKELRKPSGG